MQKKGKRKLAYNPGTSLKTQIDTLMKTYVSRMNINKINKIHILKKSHHISIFVQKAINSKWVVCVCVCVASIDFACLQIKRPAHRTYNQAAFAWANWIFIYIDTLKLCLFRLSFIFYSRRVKRMLIFNIQTYFLNNDIYTNTLNINVVYINRKLCC